MTESPSKRSAFAAACVYEFDYNISHVFCSHPDCTIYCVYHNDGQDNPGQWMKCKIGKGRIFCEKHRPHEEHPAINCHVPEEYEEEFEDEEEDAYNKVQLD